LRVDDQPAVTMQWIASSDGRTAMFKGDPVRFLRSLPDGGRITVNVSDWQGMAHEASFQLTGLDVIRQKIAAACKWTPAADRVAPAGR
jgi:riboflavin biosynthesis pyrimidine reductase